MNIANRLCAASLLVLLPLTAPTLEKDLLIVNVEAIKQAAVNAVLEAYSDVFEDDLLVDARRVKLPWPGCICVSRTWSSGLRIRSNRQRS
jgi:hypothetical protein